MPECKNCQKYEELAKKVDYINQELGIYVNKCSRTGNGLFGHINYMESKQERDFQHLNVKRKELRDWLEGQIINKEKGNVNSRLNQLEDFQLSLSPGKLLLRISAVAGAIGIVVSYIQSWLITIIN
ncbi:MAG: hypothetical protein FWE37_02650 [Spirochaetaceae bacterium]|nr:hypothetical protein [Spirochaetaceae bacterium]